MRRSRSPAPHTPTTRRPPSWRGWARPRLHAGRLPELIAAAIEGEDLGRRAERRDAGTAG
ncbi:hypothetical protein EGX94_04990 [Propionibacterium acidifaciens]|nr:hypothetical protein EGX94_04990 [Propionibacterium acidifaciens]